MINFWSMKKILGSVLVAIVSFFFISNIVEKYDENCIVKDLAFEQIEAIAQGEDGTSVGTCYLDHYSWEATQHKHCNTNTSSTMIYPCPSDWCNGSGFNEAKCTN